MAWRVPPAPSERGTVSLWVRWSASGREIFARVGAGMEKIGEMREADLANEAVVAHNTALRRATGTTGYGRDS